MYQTLVYVSENINVHWVLKNHGSRFVCCPFQPNIFLKAKFRGLLWRDGILSPSYPLKINWLMPKRWSCSPLRPAVWHNSCCPCYSMIDVGPGWMQTNTPTNTNPFTNITSNICQKCSTSHQMLCKNISRNYMMLKSLKETVI